MRYPPKVYRKDFESMEVYLMFLIVSVYMYRGSLVPRPPPFLPSCAFTVIHGSGRLTKSREGLGAFIT